MRSIKVLNETLYFAKERLGEAITVAAEGFVIQIAAQFIMIPFIFLIMFIFPILTFSGADPSIASVLFTGIYILVVTLGFVLRLLVLSIVMGGEVYCLDRVKKRRKNKFGDVFKYGWKNKFSLIGISFFNMLFTGALIFIPAALLIFLVSYVPYIPFGIFIMLVSGLIVMILAILPFLLTIMPLPFVIRNRLGTGVFASIIEAWKFYIKHFSSFYVIGLFYSMAMIVLYFVPFIGVLIMIVVPPGVIISELILMDDILGIQRFKPRYVGQDKVMSNMPPMN